MKAELLLRDRIVFGGVLPAKGNFEDLIVCDDIKEKVKITQEEIVKFGVRTIPGTQHTTWNDSSTLFGYEFSELEASVIKKALVALNAKKELEGQHMNLYRVFVKGEKVVMPEPKKEEKKEEKTEKSEEKK